MFLGHPLTARRPASSPGASRSAAPPRRLQRSIPSIDPAARIGTLKVAQRQIVEIARALLEDAKDRRHGRADLEPDAERVRAPGRSHRRARARRRRRSSTSRTRWTRCSGICQRATILRDGARSSMSVDLKEASRRRRSSRMMVGRELAQEQHSSHATSEVVLEVAGLASATKVRDVSASTCIAARCWASAGLVGVGRTELLRLIAGVDRAVRRRDPRRRQGDSTLAARATRSPPASACCRKSASAKASCRAARSAATWRWPRWAASRRAASCDHAQAASGREPRS